MKLPAIKSLLKRTIRLDWSLLNNALRRSVTLIDDVLLAFLVFPRMCAVPGGPTSSVAFGLICGAIGFIVELPPLVLRSRSESDSPLSRKWVNRNGNVLVNSSPSDTTMIALVVAVVTANHTFGDQNVLQVLLLYTE